MDLRNLIEELVTLRLTSNLQHQPSPLLQGPGSSRVDAAKLLLEIPGVSKSLLSNSLRHFQLMPNPPDLLTYIRNGCVHGYTVRNPVIIKLDRYGDQSFASNSEYQSKQRILLWHGTRAENVASILENGFKTPAANRQMFGKGIYFADRLSKSANYCDKTEHGAVGYLFLCEVAVGKSYIAEKAQQFQSAPVVTTRTGGRITCDSVLCVGEMVPDVTEHVILPNKCILPSGKTVENTNISNCTLNFNEYIVYNPYQIKIEYLVRVEFAHDVLAKLTRALENPGRSRERTVNDTCPRSGSAHTSGSGAGARAVPQRVKGVNNVDLVNKLKCTLS